MAQISMFNWKYLMNGHILQKSKVTALLICCFQSLCKLKIAFYQHFWHTVRNIFVYKITKPYIYKCSIDRCISLSRRGWYSCISLSWWKAHCATGIKWTLLKGKYSISTWVIWCPTEMQPYPEQAGHCCSVSWTIHQQHLHWASVD